MVHTVFQENQNSIVDGSDSEDQLHASSASHDDGRKKIANVSMILELEEILTSRIMLLTIWWPR